MQLLTRTPTRHYFISIFVIVSALFVTFSAVIYRHYSDAQRLNQWTLYNYEVLRQSRRILLDLVDMETGVRGYLLSGEKNFLEPYYSSRKTLKQQIDLLWDFTKNDPQTQQSISVWLRKIEPFSDTLNSQLDLLATKGWAGFSQTVLQKQKQQMDELRALIEENVRTRLEDLEAQLGAAQTQQELFKYILVLGTVLSVGGMLLTTLVILALIKRSQKAEEEARLIEDRFMTVMNSVNDGLYDYNLEDGGIYYSLAYKSMLGYTDEEHPNTMEMFKELLHPDDREYTWEALRKYRENETPLYSNVFRLRHKDGSWRWVLSRGVCIRDAAGKMTRLIGTHTDITEQKNREEELKQLNTDMENFTYIASHDLRAPLVNLKGFAREMQHALNRIKPVIVSADPCLNEEERIIVKQTLEEDIPESLRFIEQSVEKMDALTTAVLDLSRIGKHEYRFEPVDTTAVVQRCLDTLGYEISQKDIEVTLETLPEIVSDALACEQIFSNLLDNAVKYLHPQRRGHIIISAEESRNQIVFSIRDNGRGIAEADRSKIFQIFRRARNTNDIRGLGMGMAFVQATVRKLKGVIWFESTEGVGTTFFFRLPKYVMKEKTV